MRPLDGIFAVRSTAIAAAAAKAKRASWRHADVDDGRLRLAHHDEDELQSRATSLDKKRKRRTAATPAHTTPMIVVAVRALPSSSFFDSNVRTWQRYSAVALSQIKW